MTSRSARTFPKYASLTMGPLVDSGPGVNGRTIVVSADGLNIPRIHTETSPASVFHPAFPAFGAVMDDSTATVLTALPGDTPNTLATSALDNRRTVRSTS